MEMESHRRSVVKALTWRFLGVIITGSTAWVVTGSWHFAAAIGVIDTVIKLGVYYAHERVWNHVSFGRAKGTDYQI